MLAVMHHNENVEAENRGESVILRESARIGRANNAPNPRVHKTHYFK